MYDKSTSSSFFTESPLSPFFCPVPTPLNNRLQLFSLSSFRDKMLEVISQSSYVIKIITKLLRLMLVASEQAPPTFLCSSCFLYLRTFAPVPTPLGDRLALFLLSSLSAQLLASFGQYDVGYKSVATGRRVLSLCSY